MARLKNVAIILFVGIFLGNVVLGAMGLPNIDSWMLGRKHFECVVVEG